MPSPEVLDFAALLAPISEEAPCGTALRGGEPEQRAIFQKVKDAREACRLAERQSLNSWGTDDEAEHDSPDWSSVKQHAIDVLSNHSKDLWVAAWLLDALIREDQFAGVRDGFRFIRELVDTYFDQGLHPLPDEEMGDDLSETTAQLTGLFDGALSVPIDSIPICFSDDGPLTSGDYKMSVAMEQETDASAKQSRIDQGAIPLAKFESFARLHTPSDFLVANYEDAQAALAEFQQLTTVLDNKFGYEHAPPSSQLKETLEDCVSRMLSISKHAIESEELAAAETEGEGGELVAGGGGNQMVASGQAANGRVATREEAFRVLNQVAEFFERTEPQSMIPFALKQVVNWGKMSLPELLQELIADDSVLQDLERRAGVPRVEESSD